jgi:hypothetical protein
MTTKQASRKTPAKTSSLDDFRNVHDKSVIIPRRIAAAIAKLEKGVEGRFWLYDDDFRKLAGNMSPADLAAYRGQFADHWVTVTGKNPKRAWFGTKLLADEARQIEGVE